MTRVAVLTQDVLGARMAGPAIRALEMAKVLRSTGHEVRLVSTSPASTLTAMDAETATTRRVLSDVERWAEVVVFQGSLLTEHGWLMGSRKILVADLYDPIQFEYLQQHVGQDLEARIVGQQLTNQVLERQLRRGDFFLCASEKQRDLWLGHLASSGRVNPLQYDADPSLRRLIDVASFGLNPVVPAEESRPLRDGLRGVREDDVVLLWAGGLYPWFDPQILVLALASAVVVQPRLKLVFLAGRHPNPDVPEMPTARDTRRLARDLGMLDQHVFFVDTWVDYADRHNYLLDADVGVTTHHNHVETSFSFRTRVLDYLWAGLPIITSSGDHMSALVTAHRLGAAVAPGDASGLADALIASANDQWRHATAKRIAAIRESYAWPRVLRPLVAFCDAPAPAPDLRAARSVGPVLVPARPVRATKLARARRDAVRARQLLADGRGARTVGRKALARLRVFSDRIDWRSSP